MRTCPRAARRDELEISIAPTPPTPDHTNRQTETARGTRQAIAPPSWNTSDAEVPVRHVPPESQARMEGAGSHPNRRAESLQFFVTCVPQKGRRRELPDYETSSSLVGGVHSLLESAEGSYQAIKRAESAESAESAAERDRRAIKSELKVLWKVQPQYQF